MSDAAAQAADLLAGLLRHEMGHTGRVALHEPSFEGHEWDYVKDCLDTGWVSSVGAYVEKIETMTARACGAGHGVAVVNGTAGLHAALIGLGVAPGDLVVCPALTFVATANAVSQAGAQPLFVDITPDTLGIDPDKLDGFFETACDASDKGLVHRATGRQVTAVLPVHVFGHPADMTALCAIARARGLAVLEDAAEALGSRHLGKACGGFGDAGVISFNGNKTVTTGGGGVIVTDDAALAGRLKHLTTTARVADRLWFDHDSIGFNYRMPNINAALGCAQLEMLDTFIDRKRRLADRYDALFAGLDGVRLFGEPAGDASNYWLNALLFADETARDRFLELTNANSIETRPCWRLIPDTAAYAAAPRADDLSAARDIVARLVNIPSGPGLMKDRSQANGTPRLAGGSH